MSASLEIARLRRELDEALRKLDNQKSFADVVSVRLCETQDECERLRKDNLELCKRLGITPEVSAFQKTQTP